MDSQAGTRIQPRKTDMGKRGNYRRISKETWEIVRRRYEDGESPALLCQQFSIRDSTFYDRRKKEGWAVAPPPAPRKPAANDHHAELDAPPVELASGAATMPVNSETAPREQVSAQAPSTSPLAQIVRRVSEDHLRMSSNLRYRMDEMTADESLGTGPQGRTSRSLVDMATALEKIQRIERKALGMDMEGARPTQQVIVIVPQKMDPDEWGQAAAAIIDDL